MKKKKTFQVEYNYFEPGSKVTPTSSHRCPLSFGSVYEVTKCLEPSFPGDDCIVFVKGRRCGVSTEYLRIAK